MTPRFVRQAVVLSSKESKSQKSACRNVCVKNLNAYFKGSHNMLRKTELDILRRIFQH